ncbi:Nitrogen fixation regulation protein FixK [Pseudooceanicola marinus]|uniref:Nitrogen fixation regulation protein FixK n=1 Tax=Pseudooceanicola marinus TaxID=396013 RepID=A0A1X6YE34_9RHOB|nr:Crp/Fnr family transcriptional regulator [Pseudooceanicola marinus]PJE32944.1 Crp/Fnr family transcriptional regulator [Pseudooceanicola marinus]SLN17823.1 Nitrogen fixation regulation protein FixK [Pseudooceanicola marinus]
MATDCRNCPLRPRPLFDDMSESELAFMRNFKTGELEVEAGAQLMMEGANAPHLYTALEGQGLRYKTLETGERQVINFVLPGDFIGLQAGVMNVMYHTVEATTRMRLCVFNRAALWSLFEEQPERAYDLTWLSAVEERFLGESLAMLGHMSAEQRIARAFLRLQDRGTALGMVKNREMPLPYRQQDLADALGLSLVHTNKTLKSMRERGLADWRGGSMKILDYSGLCELAEMEEDRSLTPRPLI